MGVIERRLRDRQKRIDEIITAAKHLFLSKGYAGTTMNDIADKSELSRRTLYHYFDSKEAVSLAAAEETLERILKEIGIIHATSKTGLERLHKTLEVYRNMYETDPGGFHFIISFSDAIQTLGEEHDQVSRCLAQVKRIVSSISMFIREGIKDGSLNPLPHPDLTAAVLVSLAQNAIQNSVTDRDIVRVATNCPSESYFTETFSLISTCLVPKNR